MICIDRESLRRFGGFLEVYCTASFLSALSIREHIVRSLHSSPPAALYITT